MKTLIVYDSLYGNTKTIAQVIGDAIPSEVEVLHVGEVDASRLAGYDLLIVGAPTHGASHRRACKPFSIKSSRRHWWANTWPALTPV